MEAPSKGIPDVIKAVNITYDHPLQRLMSNARSIQGLKRTLALIKRWAFNGSNKNEKKISLQEPFTTEELSASLSQLITFTQQQAFPVEYESLSKNEQVKHGSLVTLTPFLQNGIIKSYGRLSNSELLPSNTKYPVILPKMGSFKTSNKNFTQLIIEEAHKETLHGGVNLMRNSIRRDFWVIHATKGCSSVRSACVTCKRFTAQVQHQLMSNLQKEVLADYRPFDVISIDYAGPFLIYLSPRKTALGKAYVLVIKCLISKRVVLELVGSMDAEAHLAAMHRAFAYTSIPSVIISDRGTNFIKGCRLIEEDMRNAILQGNRETQEFCANKSIKFKFLPPQASSTDGQHETEVRIMKTHLRKVLRKIHLTFEQLETVIKQIQLTINQRPIAPD